MVELPRQKADTKKKLHILHCAHLKTNKLPYLWICDLACAILCYLHNKEAHTAF